LEPKLKEKHNDQHQIDTRARLRQMLEKGRAPRTVFVGKFLPDFGKFLPRNTSMLV
jgi:hypothetical protein